MPILNKLLIRIWRHHFFVWKHYSLCNTVDQLQLTSYKLYLKLVYPPIYYSRSWDRVFSENSTRCLYKYDENERRKKNSTLINGPRKSIQWLKMLETFLNLLHYIMVCQVRTLHQIKKKRKKLLIYAFDLFKPNTLHTHTSHVHTPHSHIYDKRYRFFFVISALWKNLMFSQLSSLSRAKKT